jgi:tRNA (guanine37-N1)-methyltransferase
MLEVTVLTAFPRLFVATVDEGMIRVAREKARLAVHVVDLRDYSDDAHRTVDDYPYGGGAGMVLKPEPVYRAVEALRAQGRAPEEFIHLTPQGRTYTQADAQALSERGSIALLCGRYKGVDERIVEGLVTREISIGDYVLSGGEFAALVIIDSLARLLPGVLGTFDSAESDSFASGLLDGAYYTRPEEYAGRRVPAVLLSGHHEEIRRYRRREALERTWRRRPDLLRGASMDDEDRAYLAELARREPGRSGGGKAAGDSDEGGS